MKAERGDEFPYAKTVLDTNVLLSAALVPGGTTARLADAVLLHGGLVFSEATFEELHSRIWKPKFDRYLSIERRQQILHDAQAAALWIEIPAPLVGRHWSRDPDNDAFIRTALAAQATRLVSGDKDLLCLHPLQRLHILTPRQALDELAALPSPGG